MVQSSGGLVPLSSPKPVGKTVLIITSSSFFFTLLSFVPPSAVLYCTWTDPFPFFTRRSKLKLDGFSWMASSTLFLLTISRCREHEIGTIFQTCAQSGDIDEQKFEVEAKEPCSLGCCTIICLDQCVR